MSKFYFEGSSSDDDAGDIDSLPYPAPLSRPSFLTPDFTPAAYLSTLRNRHQTLEDLRADLRSRSQELSKELLDLVNSNYQDFINLGASLKGGEDKVQELRLGLLSFKREVEGIRTRVTDRSNEIRSAIDEKRKIREQIELGRKLLDIDSRIEDLERELMLISANNNLSESEESDDEVSDILDSKGLASISLKRLQRHVEQYMIVVHVMDQASKGHPFIVAQEPRVLRLKNTILLDLNSALSEAQKAGHLGETRLLRIIALFRDMGVPAVGTKSAEQGNQLK
ncbi:MAG: hypothetical protein M1814_001666 [Vezdaea aestivalis]|nr:MAG: hypothetical protein M1814_001666 [Vezdaea aestivalis]